MMDKFIYFMRTFIKIGWGSPQVTVSIRTWGVNNISALLVENSVYSDNIFNHKRSQSSWDGGILMT